MSIRSGIRSALVATLLSGCNPTDSAQPANRLVVLVGQSNAGGIGVAASVTNYPGIANAFSAVQMYERTAAGGAVDPPNFTNEGPRDLAPRITNFGGSYATGTFGVELSLGRELDAATADTWFVAKYTIDGSSLVNHWASASYPTTGGALATQLTTFIQDRATAWNVTDLANNLIVVFIQGEADTGQAYATYLSNLQSFFSGLRASLGNFLVVVHRLVSRVDSAQNVRAAEEAFAANTTKVLITHADDLALRDTAHYSDDSYVTLGIRIKTAIVDYYNSVSPTSPYVVAVGPIAETNSTGSPSPTLPPHQANDILLVVLAGNGTNNFAAPAGGWAEVGSSPQAGGGLNARIQAWWLRAAGSGTSSPTIADVASDGQKFAVAVVIRGAITSGNPFDVTAGGTAATSTSVSFPGATTTGTNRLVFQMAAIIVDNTEPQFVYNSFSNADLTEIDQQLNKCSNASTGVGMGIISARKATAGAFAATTATLSNTGTQALLTLAVKP